MSENATNEIDTAAVLATPMRSNDAGAATVGDYLRALLHKLWDEEEGFSGKRPFGNSGWSWELYDALVRAGVLDGQIDEDGYLDRCDDHAGHKMVLAAIDSLGASS